VKKRLSITELVEEYPGFDVEPYIADLTTRLNRIAPNIKPGLVIKLSWEPESKHLFRVYSAHSYGENERLDPNGTLDAEYQ
jgi:hypothetical protein